VVDATAAKRIGLTAMNTLLLAAAGILALVGAAHSYLGERYIVMRLLGRTDLPQLRGTFTRRTIRFAWHCTTIAWWGLSAILVMVARDRGEVSASVVVRVVAVTSLVTALFVLGGSRGRHLAWVAFLAVALLAWFGVR
jgi:hypothetical protein